MVFGKGGRRPKKKLGPGGCFFIALPALLIFILGGGISIAPGGYVSPVLVNLFWIVVGLVCISLVAGVVFGFVKIFKQSVGLDDGEDEI